MPVRLYQSPMQAWPFASFLKQVHKSILFILGFLFFFPGCAVHAGMAPAPTQMDPADLVVLEQLAPRLRYATDADGLGITSASAITLVADSRETPLPPGKYHFKLESKTPARQRFHVFSKTFLPNETVALNGYLAECRAQGHDPEIETFGKQFKTRDARIIDNRQFWISIARFNHEAEAQALVKRLAGQQVFAWIRPETIAWGEGRLAVIGPDGKVLARIAVPATIRATAPLQVTGVDSGFWSERRADRAYQPPLTLEVGPDGALEAYGRIPLEKYLKGVLPAEMPFSWPAEALKAQAVAARSEVLANLAAKHRLEGFDFCATEHCRAYTGLAGHQSPTDAAVDQTRGLLLIAEGRIVPTVFSASCGGWSEDNEIVWSGPPQAALRAVPDFPPASKPSPGGPVAYGIDRWLNSSPPAYCSADKDSFRWNRRYTIQELSQTMNRHYPVGAIRNIEMGDRGPGGRLKWVRVTGTNGVETIHKELPIRRAFGALPSAMCIINVERRNGEAVAVSIVGGGRGHGVGLCQHGARGMAIQGITYDDILNHYFSGAKIERVQ
jgi:SpoIID/LytB domain protein